MERTVINDGRKLYLAESMEILQQPTAVHLQLQNNVTVKLFPSCISTISVEDVEEPEHEPAVREDAQKNLNHNPKNLWTCSPWNRIAARYLQLTLLATPDMAPLTETGLSTEKVKWFSSTLVRLCTPPEFIQGRDYLHFHENLQFVLSESAVKNLSCMYESLYSGLPNVSSYSKHQY